MSNPDIDAEREQRLAEHTVHLAGKPIRVNPRSVELLISLIGAQLKLAGGRVADSIVVRDIKGELHEVMPHEAVGVLRQVADLVEAVDRATAKHGAGSPEEAA